MYKSSTGPCFQFGRLQSAKKANNEITPPKKTLNFGWVPFFCWGYLCIRPETSLQIPTLISTWNPLLLPGTLITACQTIPQMMRSWRSSIVASFEANPNTSRPHFLDPQCWISRVLYFFHERLSSRWQRKSPPTSGRVSVSDLRSVKNTFRWRVNFPGDVMREMAIVATLMAMVIGE